MESNQITAPVQLRPKWWSTVLSVPGFTEELWRQRDDGQPRTGELSSCPTAEQLVKDVPELCVEGGVDDRVDGTVDVAEPRYHGDEGWANLTGGTQHLSDMNNEEWRPTGQKYS